MADPRFFNRSGPFDLAAVLERTGAKAPDSADTSRKFVDVAPLETAKSDEIGFLDNEKYVAAFERSEAGACFVTEKHARRAPGGTIPLVTARPYLAFAHAARLYYPPSPPAPGVAPDALIDGTAEVGEGSRIDSGAIVGAGVEIGARCRVSFGAVLCDGVRIGDDCHVGPGATLMCCLLGDRVWIDAGVRIGTQGFGFAIGPEGPVRIPHSGRVVIGSDVEIGANTTIDRGTAGDTEIGDFAMIDNQVQIAHNAKVGRGAVLAGQVGLAGSAQVGDFAMIGGKSGVSNHVKVGAGARIGALSGAAGDLDAGGTYLGQPAVAIGDFWRQQAVVRRLAKRDRGK